MPRKLPSLRLKSLLFPVSSWGISCDAFNRDVKEQPVIGISFVSKDRYPYFISFSKLLIESMTHKVQSYVGPSTIPHGFRFSRQASICDTRQFTTNIFNSELPTIRSTPLHYLVKSYSGCHSQRIWGIGVTKSWSSTFRAHLQNEFLGRLICGLSTTDRQCNQEKDCQDLYVWHLSVQFGYEKSIKLYKDD